MIHISNKFMRDVKTTTESLPMNLNKKQLHL